MAKPEAKQGDTVKVHYTGTLEGGEVFDTSRGREPLEFTLGAQQVIPGFEKAVEGMSEGDSNTATVGPDEAYGPYRADMVMEVDRDQFPEDIQPEIGQQLQIRQANGQSFIVTVKAVSDSMVTLDANHPLAGKDLTFDIELVEIG